MCAFVWFSKGGVCFSQFSKTRTLKTHGNRPDPHLGVPPSATFIVGHNKLNCILEVDLKNLMKGYWLSPEKGGIGTFYLVRM